MKRSFLAGLFGGMVALSPGLRSQELLALTLDQAVALAVAVSPDLRAIVIQENSSVDAYRWGIRESLPKVGLNYSKNESILTDAADTRSIRAGVTVTQPLFDAGRTGRKRDLARLRLQSDRYDYQIQLERVTDSVKSLFNQILVLKEKLGIQDKVVELGRGQAALSRKEWELGSAREIDVLDTEAQVSSLRVDKKQSQRNLADALFQLANLLGLDPSVPLDVAGQFDADYEGLALPESSGRWRALALDSSKDLAQQKLELRKQYFSLLDANLWYLPEISLETMASLTGVRFPLQTPAFNATLTLSFPNEAFPVTQTAGLGGTPGESRTSSAATSVGVLDSVQGIVNASGAKAQYQLSQVKEGVLGSATRYNLEKTMGDYRLLVEKLALQRNTVSIEVKKNAILAKQVSLGVSKRLDYLKGETQLAGDRISLVESVLQIKEAERALEQLLHLQPGTLAKAVQEDQR